MAMLARTWTRWHPDRRVDCVLSPAVQFLISLLFRSRGERFRKEIEALMRCLRAERFRTVRSGAAELAVMPPS